MLNLRCVALERDGLDSQRPQLTGVAGPVVMSGTGLAVPVRPSHDPGR